MLRAAPLLALAIGLAMPLRAQCPDGAPPPCRGAVGAPATAAPNSVAVLTFDNLSRDTADTYLVEGLANDQFDRAANDLLDIQRDVATAVASEVAGRLSPQERSTPGERSRGSTSGASRPCSDA